MRSLTADNPPQQQRLDTLEQLTGEKLEELDQTIALRRAGNAEAALALVRTDRGKAAMDRIRALIAEMESEEREPAREPPGRVAATPSRLSSLRHLGRLGAAARR